MDHVPLAVIAAHRGQLELARAHSERGLRLAEEQFGLHTPVHLGTIGHRRSSGRRPSRGRSTGSRRPRRSTTRLGWREPGNRWWMRRPRRDAARARPAGRRRANPRRVGGGCASTRTRPGCSRRSRAAAASSPPHAGTSPRPRRSSRTRSRSTRTSATPSGGRARCSRSASSAGGERQKRAARDAIGAALDGFERARRRDLDREGPRGARPDRRPHARGGADARGAPCRRARRRGPHEPRGRRRALPGRADGRDAPVTRLRQARRALARRARADVPAGRAKFRGTHDFKLSRARLASSGCRATSSRRSSHAAPQVSVRRVSGGRARPPRR